MRKAKHMHKRGMSCFLLANVLLSLKLIFDLWHQLIKNSCRAGASRKRKNISDYVLNILLLDEKIILTNIYEAHI